MPACADTLSWKEILPVFPPWLLRQLAALWRQRPAAIYLAGGTVRDLLLGRLPADIDLTVPRGAKDWAQRFAALSGGTLIPLGRNDDAARVVCQGRTIDFSAFREGTSTIFDDLCRRDLTINSLAVRIDSMFTWKGSGKERLQILDPTGGRVDLARGVIRASAADCFVSDPLRLLRVFRFAAAFDFSIDSWTLDLVSQQPRLLLRSAPERIAAELDLIMASSRAAPAFAVMAESGLLAVLLPELMAGSGMMQPKSHHLDVLGHSLEALRQMERIMAVPEAYFPGCEPVLHYLADQRNRIRLKWAALLHDVGKPATCARRADRGDRITFYNHDRAGAGLSINVGRRLRWSNDDSACVAHLIGGHMRPFHLANVARDGNLSLKACIRMVKMAGTDLPGLFLLAVADALAGQGEERIAGMEGEMLALYRRLEEVDRNHVAPVRKRAPLLTGRDLIEVLHLEPGPVFRTILDTIEEAEMEAAITDYNGALELARAMLREQPANTRTIEG